MCDEQGYWKRRFQEEARIVDRVWQALGISKYEEAGGKAIWEIVADFVAKAQKSDKIS